MTIDLSSIEIGAVCIERSAMLVPACACQNRRNRPHTAPPSQRSEAIKVYSTFFRDDFIWTLSRCTIRVSLFFLSCCCFRISFSCEYFRLCVIRKMPLRSIRMQFFSPFGLSLAYSRFGNCKNVLKI